MGGKTIGEKLFFDEEYIGKPTYCVKPDFYPGRHDLTLNRNPPNIPFSNKSSFIVPLFWLMVSQKVGKHYVLSFSDLSENTVCSNGCRHSGLRFSPE